MNDTAEEIWQTFLREKCGAFILAQNVKGGRYTAENPKLIRLFNIRNEKTFLTHDDTAFRTGKSGFALTDRGIYVRGLLGGPVIYTSFADLLNFPAPVTKNVFHLFAGSRLVGVYSDFGRLWDYQAFLQKLTDSYREIFCREQESFPS